MNEQDLDSLGGQEIEAAFFADGYQLAKEHVSKELSTKTIYTGIKQLYDALDEFLELFLETASQGGVPSVCARGCSWCCNQTVYAQNHELEYLRIWMQLNKRQDEIRALKRIAEEKSIRTARMSKDDRSLFKSPCPMLNDGACSVYPARPVACRIYLSFDVESCKYENEHPEDKQRIPKLYEFPFKAGRKMNEGFTKWLTEHGKHIEEFTLEQGIAQLL